MSTQRVVGATDRGLSWFKSSYSGGSGGNCVEVARSLSSVRVRDTKNRTGPALSIPPHQWSAFVAFTAEPNR